MKMATIHVKSNRKSKWGGCHVVLWFVWAEQDGDFVWVVLAVQDRFLQLWLPVMLLSSRALSPRFWCTAALNSLRRAALIFRACFWSPSLLSLSLSVWLSLLHKLSLSFPGLSKINGLNSCSLTLISSKPHYRLYELMCSKLEQS